MSDFYLKAKEESKLRREGYDRAMVSVREILDELQNPYPKDIFLWENEETLDFDRGRFNQHCFEIWVNCKNKISSEITALTGSEEKHANS